MKVSIITISYNSEDTVEETIRSVLAQSHRDIEYIIVDGRSTDGTWDRIKAYADKVAVLISEPDHGIYDAMNKGIARATGDVVGFLNSDDVYAHPDVIRNVVSTFCRSGSDSVYADVAYVDRAHPEKVVRYYSSSKFRPERLAYGWMPAHPTFFVRRSVYTKYGNFQTTYRIAADYELVARFLYRHRVSYTYIPEVLVKMRTGGISTRGLRSNWIISREIVRACSENGIETHLAKVLLKYPLKMLELVRRST